MDWSSRALLGLCSWSFWAFCCLTPHSQRWACSNSAGQKKEARSSKLQALLSQDAKIVIKNTLIYT